MNATLYGIPNCDKCRAARKWFDAQDNRYTFHDLRADGISQHAIAGWLKAAGSDALINKRSTTWRQLSDAERARAESDPAGLLAANVTLIKRPLVQVGNELVVGYDEQRWSELLAR